MTERLERWIYGYMTKSSLESDEEKYLALYSLAAAAFAGVLHVALLAYYCVVFLPLFININICSILCYVIVFFLSYKKRYFESATLMSVEVLIYTYLTSYFLGLNNFTIFYILLILVMQIMVPYASQQIRLRVGVVIWICSIVIIVSCDHLVPVIDLGRAEAVLSFFNVQVSILGVLTVIVIDGLIRKIISRYNEMLLEKYRVEATTDPLTGLPNRRKINLMIEDLKHAQEQWYVAMVDIDDFKKVNDRYGHQVGDEALKMVAGIMERNIRKTDVAFRWGGEEFLICLRNVTRAEAFDIFEQIRLEIAEQAIPLEKSSLYITVTIGAVPLNAKNIMKSVEESDMRMYQGKGQGKNQVIIA